MLANFSAPELRIPADVPRRLTAQLDVEVQTEPTRVRAWADVEHTDTTDLMIVAIAPDGTETVLHDREHLNGTRHSFSAEVVLGQVDGRWTLRVDDVRGGDGGKVSVWGVEVVERARRFGFDVVFEGEWSSGQREACIRGLSGWERAITGALEPVELPDGWVENHRVVLRAEHIDGPGGTLGMSGPTAIRWSSKLPAESVQTLDVADRDALHDRGQLGVVVRHEAGHGLGLYLPGLQPSLFEGLDTTAPLFVGAQAFGEYGKLGGIDFRGVPLEPGGGPGTRNVHLAESVFRTALLSGWLNSGANPLTRISIAALADYGYEVDLDAADPYTLPGLAEPSLRVMGARSCDVERPTPEVV